jgi:hypothetical protein
MRHVGLGDSWRARDGEIDETRQPQRVRTRVQFSVSDNNASQPHEPLELNSSLLSYLQR